MYFPDEVKIGIVGYGTVGQVTHALLPRCTVTISDPLRQFGIKHAEDFADTSVIFVCLPTELNGVIDTSVIKNFLRSLQKAQYSGIVCVRTTCTIHMLKSYDLKIVYFPCFIQENSSINEQIEMHKINIIGGFEAHCQRIVSIFDEYSPYKTTFIKTSLDNACAVKLARNLYGAYKVLFWNFVQNTLGNARAIHDLMKELPEQGDMHIVGLDGELGYGGKCFPNNVELMRMHYKNTLINFLKDYNNELKRL